MRPDPTVPPVAVVRRDERSQHQGTLGAHTHDFLALNYFTGAGGALRSRTGPRPINVGDLYVVAPGDVIEESTDWTAEGIGLFFTLDALGPHRPEALLSWQSHPLLFPFVRGSAPEALRLSVPVPERDNWTSGISAIETELAQRRDGYRQAVLAHLVLRLVDVARLAGDVITQLRTNDEPLLAEVFTVIERRYAEQLSLSDVARAVALTPGHLTTAVRRRTGRTVQDWITERRMSQARRLLTETELPVGEVGRRAGYADPAYFARAFRREHGVAPRQWRAG